MEDYENIIREYQNNTNTTSPDPYLAELLDDFGSYLCDKYDTTGEISDLQKMIEIVGEAFDETPRDDKYWRERLLRHGVILFYKYDLTQELEDLDRVIWLLQGNIDVITPDDLPYTVIISLLEESLHALFSETRDIAVIDRCICIIRLIINTTLPDHLYQSILSSMLANCLDDRFNCVGEMADLEEAICLGQDLIDSTPLNHPDRAMHLSFLAMRFDNRYSSSGDIVDLNKAISLACEACDIAPLEDLVLVRLQKGQYLCRRFLHPIGDIYDGCEETADLDEAIYMAFETIELCPTDNQFWNYALRDLGITLAVRNISTATLPDADSSTFTAIMRDIIRVLQKDDPLRAQLICALGTCLTPKHKHTGAAADLDERIYTAFKNVELCSINNEKWNHALSDLGLTLAAKYISTTALADVDSSTFIIMIQEIISIFQLNDPLRVPLLQFLGAYFANKHERTGAAGNLDEAIRVSRDILHSALLDDVSELDEIRNLTSRLSARHAYTGALSDIEEAILITEMAIESIPIDHPQRMTLLIDLGGYHRHKYEYTGATIDLDEAIRIGQYCLDVIPKNHHKIRCDQLQKLSMSFLEKYKCTGAFSNIEKSIILIREGVACTLPSSTDRSAFLDGLGTTLFQKYSRTNAIEDLNEAIGISQEVLEVTSSDYFERAVRLHNCAGILSARFKHSGEIADLNEAVLISREASSFNDTDNLAIAPLLYGFGETLLEKYNHTQSEEDLEEAIRTFQHVVDMIPQNHPDRAVYLTHLGMSLNARASFSEGLKTLIDGVFALLLADLTIDASSVLEDLPSSFGKLHNDYYLGKILADNEKAQKCFIDGLYHSTAKVRDRVSAGREALRLPYLINYEKAYDVAEHTIDLIPLLTSRSLQNSDKQSMLSIAVGASSDAAAIALHALPAHQRLLAAIECLEKGRGLIGKALFEQYEISILKQHNPSIADSLLTLQYRLDGPILPDLSSATYRATRDIEAEGNKRCEIEQEYSELLETVRLKNGFERFLLPASEANMLHAAACGGPIVILNISCHRCDALIIRQSGLEELALPPLLSEPFIDEYSKDLESIETLAWLWENIVSPVLDALGFTAPPVDGIWPHVWWIPTGKLTKFPLHAAGHHLRRSGETTLDRVVSSYATSVKAIIHTRRRGDPKVMETLNLVAIAMPETEGHTSLIHASHEVDVIVHMLKSQTVNCDQPQQYKSSVLSAMSNCQIFHFAGHGKTHPTDPLQSSLLLKDWEHESLTVASLLETNLSLNPPFLAYLSACGTGQTLHDDSIDESIHLVNAFQLAGFRHVIGTLWSVDDEICVEIAKMTYSSFSRGLSDDVVSGGLHNAVRALRDRWVNMTDERAEKESRAVDGLREGRHAQLDDCEELGRPLWIPFVHFGV